VNILFISSGILNEADCKQCRWIRSNSSPSHSVYISSVARPKWRAWDQSYATLRRYSLLPPNKFWYKYLQVSTEHDRAILIITLDFCMLLAMFLTIQSYAICSHGRQWECGRQFPAPRNKSFWVTVMMKLVILLQVERFIYQMC
jgi:hypothetical protein